MAYIGADFQVIITGNMSSGENWANTFTFQEFGPGVSRQDAVDSVHDFYTGFNNRLVNEWAATAAVIRDLESGVNVPGSFSTVTGSSSADALPTECAIRVSLYDGAGHHGGPFLGGWATGQVDTNGLLLAAAQDAVADAIEGLANNVAGQDISLRIDRPSVPSTVAAVQAKVGLVFDVIRGRRKQISEAYDVRSLDQPT